MLNENIKKARKTKGLSQEELAAKLNVVRQTVSKWENGLSVPDSDLLISLAAALDTSVSALLGETVPERDPGRPVRSPQRGSVNPCTVYGSQTMNRSPAGPSVCRWTSTSRKLRIFSRPIPGGATEQEDRISVTNPEDLRKTLAVYLDEFTAWGCGRPGGM